MIAGDHKGKKGKVLQVIRAKNRVLVEGVNMIKKHERKTQDNPQGSISKEKHLFITRILRLLPIPNHKNLNSE